MYVCTYVLYDHLGLHDGDNRHFIIQFHLNHKSGQICKKNHDVLKILI